jgi:hypothetical protein
VLIWIFIAGGIIDRYARDRATRAYGFFSASGVFFFRFLRLAVFMAIVYGLIFRFMHPWLFDRLYPRMIQGVSFEGAASLARAALYGVFAVIVVTCNLIFDYAKVRAVVEDRRSMTGAIASALRFLRRNASSAISLYLLDVVLLLIAIGIYAVIAPGGDGSGRSVWMGIAIGQLYILARLWVRLVFWASETALFQGRFAHAGYIAAPAPAWPESPAAEAIRN